MQQFLIRRAGPEDRGELAGMRHSLWPEESLERHAEDLAPLLAGKPRGNLPAVVFVAQGHDGSLIGFIEVSLRSHADGCDPSHPVGFIEGWYVKPVFRGRQIGPKLLLAAERWAREAGCHEMASDTWLDNLDSQRVHEALGFEVVDRCVHYRKPL